jgi:RNase adaptor protein for sRNA GlmZ degradation
MQTTHRPTQGLTSVVIRSVGVRHEDAVRRISDGLYVDLSDALHNPAEDPEMRYRTGLDEDVRAHVLSTPDAMRIVMRTVAHVHALLAVAEPGRLVHLTVSCRGGRHRSVAVAEAVGEYLWMDGVGVDVEHLDIDRPVLPAAC